MTAIPFEWALILTTLAGLLAGALVTQLRAARRLGVLREENATLKATLEVERRTNAEKLAMVETGRTQLTETFAALSNQALRSSTEEFLKLARENLKQHHLQAQGDLAEKEKAIATLLRPVKEALNRTERQLQQLEKERQEAYGSLTKHLETMAATQQALQGETRNLVQALRRPEVRGQWGELTLKRLAELAGMVPHCDFYEQESTATGEGLMRPDMIVRLPDEREIVVDVKTPLDAYLSAVDAPSDANKQEHLKHHARKLRERVRELAGKAYWSQFPKSPEFVVLFIPGDQFLSAALDQDPKLLEYALGQKIILATPTSFVALLRAVAYGWRQLALAENAERIREIGEELFRRLGTFTEHLARLGKSLGSSLDHYNKAVGSLDRQVLPGARKFTELGITPRKALTDLEQLEKGVRQVESTPETGDANAKD
ncbi:MAG TPA: DNA recombination protein RmuC [Gammaproteobacteria bacterium]|nr:DNA recombination protein RmuC [Gammaproteobacteria bacterium]